MAYHKIGSMSDRLAAIDFLRTVCHADSEGYAVYDAGWSDKKVSRHVRKVSTKIVAELRREYIGKSRAHFDRWQQRIGKIDATPAASPIPTTQAPAAVVDLIGRLATLEYRINQVENMLMGLVGIGVEAKEEDRGHK